jgi:energy-coupling factor transport system ATP-binding protein
VHLTGLNKRSPRKMSGGQQQLLAVGGILAMHPHFVVMDEPVAMLDPVGKAEVLRSVREMRDKLGLTVLLSESGTDIESVCEFADAVVLMNKGTAVGHGRAGEVFADRALIEDLKIKAPQVTRLAWELGLKLPDGRVPTTTDEAYQLIAPKLQAQPVTAKLPADVAPKLGNPVVKVNGCFHTYPATPPVQALCGIDLTIRQGEMIAILGQNGSGKTTLAYHLVGVLKPTNPEAVIEVDGVNVVKAPLEETIQHINYVFQNPANQLFCETFGAEVRYGPERLGLPKDEVDRRVLEALSAVGLEKLVKEDTVGISRSGEALLSLASVLSMKPNVLIVDEPTGGLDWESGNKVMQILADLGRQGRTIAIITHDMELAARYCSRLVVMKDGLVIMDGTPREVFSQPEKLKEAWLNPPQITQLAQRLATYGMPADVLTVDEFLSLLPKA